VLGLHALRLTVAFVLVFGLAGCGPDPVMPDVTGKRLDVAKSDIKHAGFKDKVEVLGGGVFGVIRESGWQVCDQSPAAGKVVTDAPRLTVDRSCGDGSEPTESPSESAVAPSEQPSESDPSPTESATAEIVTAENSKDLAALLTERDDCADMNTRFAAKYNGRTIEFDGSIVALNKHGDDKTRYDILVSPGNRGASSTRGPNFQFKDVAIFELHLTGANIPDPIGANDKLHIIARVQDYNSTQCLFFLEPISTKVR
jgi:Domain of unknown function (DUF4839)/PASTA domain